MRTLGLLLLVTVAACASTPPSSSSPAGSKNTGQLAGPERDPNASAEPELAQNVEAELTCDEPAVNEEPTSQTVSEAPAQDPASSIAPEAVDFREGPEVRLADDGRVLVAGEATDLWADGRSVGFATYPEDAFEEETYPPGSLVVYSPGDGSTLFAMQPVDWYVYQGPPLPEKGELWRASHEDPAHPKRLALVRGADFGDAAWAGGKLYVSSTQGILELAPDTGAVEVVVRPPRLRYCWNPEGAIDVVTHAELEGEQLVFVVDRGGRCGYEGDWESTELELRLDRTTGALSLRRRAEHPVTSLAVDADERLWLADGASCHSPSPQSVSTSATLFTSNDLGESWDKVVVGDEEGPAETAVCAVLADPKRSGWLLARTCICSNGAVGDYGGELYATHDGGANWKRLAVPTEPAVAGEGLGCSAVAAIDDSLEQLVALVGEQLWRSDDAGATWSRVEGPTPLEQRTEVKLGDFVFVPQSSGLSRRGETESMVFPGIVDVRLAASSNQRYGIEDDDVASRLVARVRCEDPAVLEVAGVATERVQFRDPAAFESWAPSARMPSWDELRCEGDCCEWLGAAPGGLYVSKQCFLEDGSGLALTRIEYDC